MSQNNFIVNGRTVVHQESEGFAQAQSINFTGTAKIPVPYTVRAEGRDLDNLCKGLMVNGNPCATIESFVSQCSGDESGDGGGIFSGTIGDRCDFLTASPDTLASDSGLLIDGQPVVREGDSIILNQRNSAPSTWQQDKGKRLNADPLETFAPSDLPTPYLIDVTVLGVDPCFSHQYLGLSEEKSLKPIQLLPCAQHSEDADNYWRRISFTHLTPEDKHLMLYVPSDAANALAIPFPVDAQPTTINDSEKPDYSKQQNCLIPVKFCPHFIPDDGKIQPATDDLSDIFRLDDDLRMQIYSRLIHHQLSDGQKKLINSTTPLSKFFKLEQLTSSENGSETPKSIKEFDQSWYDLIGPRLRCRVDQYLASQKSQTSLHSGFIYLFLNGTLWRELAFDTQGLIREVDLEKDAGKDRRAIAGLADSVVYLPWTIAGEQFDIELAFSEVQWSWARVNYFGGIDDSDLRFKGKSLGPAASKANSQSRREKRFLSLDLSTFAQEQPGYSVSANNGVIHALCSEEQIPVIYLPAPLCPIENGLKDIASLIEKLEELAQAIQLEPHFLTATTCYRYFFDERVAHNETLNEADKQKQKREVSSELYKDYKRYSPEYLKNMAKSQFPEQSWDNLNHDQIFDKYFELNLDEQGKGELAGRIRDGKPNEMKEQQCHLDEPRIKAVLKVELRQRLREMIRLVQQTVVSLLEATEEGFAVTSLSPKLKTLTDLSYIEVLRDYFSLGPYHYEKAFSALVGLTTWIAIEPAQVDKELDIRNDFDANKANTGQRFIQSLLDENHPLHPMIFAKEVVIDDAEEDSDNDGSGDFSAVRYAFCWSSLESLSMDKIVNKTSDIIHQMVSAFSMNVINAVATAEEKTVKSAHKLIYQLLEASNHEVMSAINSVTSIDLQQSDHVIIGLKSEKAKNSATSAQVIPIADKRNKNRAPYSVHLNQSGDAVVSHSTLPKGNSAIIDAIHAQNDLKAYWKKAPEAIAVRQHFKIETTPPVYILKANSFGQTAGVASSDTIVWPASLTRVLEKGSGLLKENAANIDRAATSILSILSVMNLYTVAKAYSEQSKNANVNYLDKLELYSSIAGFIYSIEVLAVAMVKLEKVVEFSSRLDLVKDLMKSGPQNLFLLTPLAFIGSVGLAFSFCSSLFQMVNLMQEHDYSAAFSKGLLAVVDLGGVFSIMGMAVSRALRIQAEELAIARSISMAEAMMLVTKRFMAQQGFRAGVLRFLLPFSTSGFGVLLIASGYILEIIYEWCKDKPLTHWVKNCSFSRHSLNQVQKNKTDFDQVLGLSELIFKPEARLQELPVKQKGRRLVRLIIDFPHFVIGKHKLSLHTLLLHKAKAISLSTGASHTISYQEQELVATTVNYSIKDREQLTKIELLYELSEADLKAEKPTCTPLGLIAKNYEIKVFFRLHLDDDMLIPAVESRHHYQKADDYSQEPKDDSSWYSTSILSLS